MFDEKYLLKGGKMTYISDELKKEKENYLSLIKKQAKQLADLLAESPEYQQYIIARNKLADDDEQSYILDELRQQQISLRLAAIMGEDTKDEIEDFDQLYAVLSGNPVISDYLFAEGRLFHLIADVEEVFSDKLQLEQFPQADKDESNNALH